MEKNKDVQGAILSVTFLFTTAINILTRGKGV